MGSTPEWGALLNGEQDKSNVEGYTHAKDDPSNRKGQNPGMRRTAEQQMLAIARALLARPKLLMLDEPSLGLAPRVVKTIFQVIRQINRAGATILLVEQNAAMALQVAHRAYVIEVGSIEMEGPAAELAASDDVRKAYLGAH
jgi:branched-chain amino acid transport system ATP-binding protein